MRALDVTCPFCEASAGEACRDTDNNEASVHPARRREALAARAAGIQYSITRTPVTKLPVSDYAAGVEKLRRVRALARLCWLGANTLDRENAILADELEKHATEIGRLALEVEMVLQRKRDS